MSELQLGIIAGSGLPEIKDLLQDETLELMTPFGRPSSPISTGTLNGVRVAFINRHGPGHTLTPNEINYRANIFALKSLGVTRIIAVSACGSLRDDFAIGDFVVPDQLFDYTNCRERSFFGNGIVTHINVADPFCRSLSKVLAESASQSGRTVRKSGTYLTIEGTRFSTRAESNIYRAWGMSIVGMTAAPEAFLAREAEICYSLLAYVTNYDVWHLDEEPVSARSLRSSAEATSQALSEVISQTVKHLPETADCRCSCALDDAFLSNPTFFPEDAADRLAPLLNRYLQAHQQD